MRNGILLLLLVAVVAVGVASLPGGDVGSAYPAPYPSPYPRQGRVYLPMLFGAGGTVAPNPTQTPVPAEQPTSTPLPTQTTAPTPSPTPGWSCTQEYTYHFGLDALAYWDVYPWLRKGQYLYIKMTVYGGSRDGSFAIYDSNGAKLVQESVSSIYDWHYFWAPYSDTYTLRVSNPSWFNNKTVDLSLQICGY
ncbi:MAG: hypothetical protein M1343_13910 [Chloroflexi bacterium]|nr:hypothetical protein [Chloroflexota bacterium]MDA8189304.1 hypothetical protein [Dehalococcoidales bacterium]